MGGKTYSQSVWGSCLRCPLDPPLVSTVSVSSRRIETYTWWVWMVKVKINADTNSRLTDTSPAPASCLPQVSRIRPAAGVRSGGRPALCCRWPPPGFSAHRSPTRAELLRHRHSRYRRWRLYRRHRRTCCCPWSRLCTRTCRRRRCRRTCSWAAGLASRTGPARPALTCGRWRATTCCRAQVWYQQTLLQDVPRPVADGVLPPAAGLRYGTSRHCHRMYSDLCRWRVTTCCRPQVCNYDTRHCHRVQPDVCDNKVVITLPSLPRVGIGTSCVKRRSLFRQSLGSLRLWWPVAGWERGENAPGPEPCSQICSGKVWRNASPCSATSQSRSGGNWPTRWASPTRRSAQVNVHPGSAHSKVGSSRQVAGHLTSRQHHKSHRWPEINTPTHRQSQINTWQL